MELSHHITNEQILLSVDVRDKWELLDMMINAVLRHPICQKQTPAVQHSIRQAVVERERDVSTDMGCGFALPHARVRGFPSFVISIAVLQNPILFGDDAGGEPVRVVCMVICPDENPTIALKVMSALMRFLTDETSNYVFYNESDPARMFNYFKEKRIDLDISITARDIMATKFTTVPPDLPLQKVTHLMNRKRLNAVGVVDESGILRGEITCDLLFSKGIPDFFKKLSSISFIKDFDPFEKYFAEESHSVASQVMSGDYADVGESATLMEIVYLLSVKNHPKVYVTDNGKLLGTIDRATVLDQILNL